MAGDWIKVEHSLPEKPEIDRLSDELGIDPDAVVGKLVRLWSWVDQHSLDGNALSVTEKGLDRRTGVAGFASALRKVGWLEGRDAALSFPNFSRHNGQTAKQRALTNRRVTELRASKCNAPIVTSALPEKRREDIDTPPKAPQRLSAQAGVVEGADSKMLPTTEQSKRIAAIFHRRLTSPWDDNEVKAYKKLGTVPEEDLAALERYYAANWPPKREANILRHALIAFLNNFQCEVGRAHAFETKPTMTNGTLHFAEK